MCKIAVAPLVGAWIEIFMMSPKVILVTVAPLVGAWIEMQMNVLSQRRGKVAPLVGAWIEIDPWPINVAPSKSRSPCGSVD